MIVDGGEDRLFDEKIIKLIEGIHDVVVDKESIGRRVRWRGYEIDVIFTAYTKNKGFPRIFIVELKETNIAKVLLQASKRSLLAHYTYTVICHKPYYIVDYIIRHWKALIPLIADSGIGIISYEKPYTGGDVEPVLVRPAKFNNIKIETLTRYINKKYRS